MRGALVAGPYNPRARPRFRAGDHHPMRIASRWSPALLVTVAMLCVAARASSAMAGAAFATPVTLRSRALSLPSLPFLGPPHVDVDVRERPGADVWELRYRFPRAVAGIELPHGDSPYRRQAWSIRPTGTWVDATATKSDGMGTPERLCFTQPERELRVSFRSDFATRLEGHALVASMSDGARILGTSSLLVRPLARCDADATGDTLLHRFRFTTDAGRTIRVGSLAASGTLRWQPESGHEETYVYFGPQAAAAGNDKVSLVVDPAAPAWLRDELPSLTGRILDRFGGETAIALAGPPLVLLAADGSGSGDTVQGDAYDGVLRLALHGDGWARWTPEIHRRWTVALAHQLFRLWDDATYRADGESAWLARALPAEFAQRAAWGLGELPAEELAATHVELANECLVELGDGPLLTAAARGAEEAYTTCGPVLLWVADRAVERKHPGEGGLGLLVRDMLQEAGATHTYGTGLFLGWLDKLAGDRDLVLALQGVIRRGVPGGSGTLLAALLRQGGLPVTLVPAEEARASAAAYGALLRSGLVRCACGDLTAATPDPGSDGARLAGGARLTSAGGVDVAADPAGAFARLRAAANLGRPLRVMTD